MLFNYNWILLQNVCYDCEFRLQYYILVVVAYIYICIRYFANES